MAIPLYFGIAEMPESFSRLMDFHFAVIGGSGVTVAGKDRFCFATPFGMVTNISFREDPWRLHAFARRDDECVFDTGFAMFHTQWMTTSVSCLSIGTCVLPWAR
jgi:hypothetical protein